MENEVMQDKSLAFFAVSICALAMTVAAWGLAKLWITLIETVGRNPQVKNDVQTFGFIGMGSIEAVALYMFVVAVLMIFF
jgi:F0F1-type ATP synthase membrane subunit c/vacuolar-type H+-ATPase subunit K